MAMASLVKVILGSIAFSIFWVMAVFPSVPFLPIGRTAGSLLGAMLMVLFRVITPEQAFAAVDLPILGLLFGTMVVSVYLERADMFKYLGKLLSWKSHGAKDLLCRICLVAAVSASLFTNDTACVVLTEFVLKVARRHDLPPHPFLLALASSANIGSAVTPIGNPQNLVIAVQSGIPFGSFLRGVAPAMLVGVAVNAAVLLACYWRVLTVKKAPDEPAEGADAAVEAVSSRHRFSPATLTHFSSATNLDLDGWVPHDKIETLTLQSSPNIIAATERLRHRLNSATENEIQKVLSEVQQNHHLALDVNCMSNGGNPNRVVSVNGFTESNASSVKPRTNNNNNNNNSNNNITPGIGTRIPEKWKTVVWKCCVYSVTVGMLVALLSGLDMSWTAITAALALVVLDFQDAQQCLEKVSYSLLIFFCGMFVTVDGFNKTGIPSTLWESIEPYAKIDHPAGTAILALVILGLCNLASNVPTVLLLGARVAASAAVISEAQEKRAWLILAWVSTVAGNLSLLGSAANLIVCEQARRAPELGYNLTFWTHLKFGLPSTLIVTAIGLTFIR